MTKVTLQHELLDSKIATATALFSEWLKWCDENGIQPYAIPHITASFNIKPEDYKREK